MPATESPVTGVNHRILGSPCGSHCIYYSNYRSLNQPKFWEKKKLSSRCANAGEAKPHSSLRSPPTRILYPASDTSPARYAAVVTAHKLPLPEIARED